MRTNLAVFLISVLALSGCQSEQADEGNPDLIRPTEEVQAMREISGRWQSAENILPGQDGRYMVMDIANDKSVSFEIRMVGAKMPVVVAEAKGKLAPNQNFTSFSGDLPEAPDELSVVRSFSFDKPSAGVIRVKGSSSAFDMRYEGP